MSTFMPMFYSGDIFGKEYAALDLSFIHNLQNQGIASEQHHTHQSGLKMATDTVVNAIKMVDWQPEVFKHLPNWWLVQN